MGTSVLTGDARDDRDVKLAAASYCEPALRNLTLDVLHAKARVQRNGQSSTCTIFIIHGKPDGISCCDLYLRS